jgi:hypothetical protein
MKVSFQHFFNNFSVLGYGSKAQNRRIDCLHHQRPLELTPLKLSLKPSIEGLLGGKVNMDFKAKLHTNSKSVKVYGMSEESKPHFISV